MDDTTPALIVDLFRQTPRQGPGEAGCTRTALRLLTILPGESLRILDIGCGTGAQTAVLAEMTAGPITAVDLLPEFLEELRLRLPAEYDSRITPVCASMDALPFPPESFDLIWSEGAAYHLGLARALRLWRPLLAPGGRIALTELTLAAAPSEETVDYWRREYPQVGDEAANKRIFEDQGFDLRETFALPSRAWDAYYRGIKTAVPAFLERNGHSPEAVALADSCRAEEAFRNAHGEHYNYIFYLAAKA